MGDTPEDEEENPSQMELSLPMRRARERRRRMSLDSNLYPAGRRYAGLPPSPRAGQARMSFAPFNSPFNPKLTPGQRARDFLEKAVDGKLLEIVNEGDSVGGTKTPRSQRRRGSLDDLSRVLGRYTRSRQHVFDAIKTIKKQEECLDNKLENMDRKLGASEKSLEHLMHHVSQRRRGSFTAGSMEAEQLAQLQKMGREWQTERANLLRSQSEMLNSSTSSETIKSDSGEGVREEEDHETDTPAPPELPVSSEPEPAAEQEVAKEEEQVECEAEEETAVVPGPETQTETPVPVDENSEKRDTRPTSAQEAIRVQTFEFST